MSITTGFGKELENDGEAPFLKGIDFDGGLELEVVGMEVFTPKDAQYSVSHTYGVGGVITKENYLVKSEVCKEGESLRYNFIKDGLAKYFDNHSASLFFEMKKANLEKGDKILMKRIMGDSPADTKWSIIKQ